MIRSFTRHGLALTFSISSLTAHLLVSVAIGFAQSVSPAPMESVQDLAAKLTPQQKQQFDEAMKAFKGQRYADAITNLKSLRKELPDDPVLSKIEAESALNTGDRGLALTLVKPIAQADPNDWQAVALLTRACAESGDASCRDLGISHMLDLHQHSITPQGMRDYTLERIRVDANTLLIRASLEPWGNYKVYYLGRVSDGEGKILLRITLESNDGDQGVFAKEHPKEAAEGLRQFSLDGYRDTGLNTDGHPTQTHYTYKFFVGQPPYETVREEFIKVANGTSKPLSSRSNLIGP